MVYVVKGLVIDHIDCTAFTGNAVSSVMQQQICCDNVCAEVNIRSIFNHVISSLLTVKVHSRNILWLFRFSD